MRRIPALFLGKAWALRDKDNHFIGEPPYLFSTLYIAKLHVLDASEKPVRVNCTIEEIRRGK